MSESRGTNSDGGTGRETTVPRAVLHKKILDAAEERLDASMEELAEEVSFATTTLVERVLEEYGDPAIEDDDDSSTAEGGGGETGTEGREGRPEEMDDSPPVGPSGEDAGGDGTGISRNTAACEGDGGTIDDEETSDHDGNASAAGTGDASHAQPEPDRGTSLDPSDLTEKQRETLLAVYDRPDATQAELADRLGVSSATINQRVNSIDGFDWSDRTAIVESLFDEADIHREHADDESATAVTGASESRPESRSVHRDSIDDESGTEALTDPEASADPVDQQCEELATNISHLAEQVEALEERVETPAQSGSCGLTDPELAHKVLYACLKSERISEAEERQILEQILTEKRR